MPFEPLYFDTILFSRAIYEKAKKKKKKEAQSPKDSVSYPLFHESLGVSNFRQPKLISSDKNSLQSMHVKNDDSYSKSYVKINDGNIYEMDSIFIRFPPY